MIEKIFEDRYFGEDTGFMVFVEQRFISNELYKGDYIDNEIWSYYGDYLNYCDNLTKEDKKELLIKYK